MPHQQLENVRVLVVDDQSSLHDDFYALLSPPEQDSDEFLECESLLFGLEAEPRDTTPNFELRSAFQGLEAIRIVQTSTDKNQPFALVFLDVRMPPGIDGVATLGKLWEIDPRLEVVLCSAFSDLTPEEIRAMFPNTDQLEFIPKPFDPEEIRTAARIKVERWNTRNAQGVS